MKKYLFILLCLFSLVPLNAQKVIKYVTFYPIPYGSHEELDVAEKAYINARDNSQTEIVGNLIYQNSSTYNGSLLLKNNNDNTTLGTQGTIRSGNGNLTLESGRASVYDTLSDFGVVIDYLHSSPDVSVADVTTLQSDTTLNSKSLSGLVGCTENISWGNLRLKGTEECKKYLICGGGSTGTSNGCELSEDMCSAVQCWNGSNCISNPGNSYQYNGRCHYHCQTSAWVCKSGTGWDCTNKIFDPKQTGSVINVQENLFTSNPTSTCSSGTRGYFVSGGRDAVSACNIEGSNTIITRDCVAYLPCISNTNGVGYLCSAFYLSCMEDNGLGCEEDTQHGCNTEQCWNGSSCVNNPGSSMSCIGNKQNATGGILYRNIYCAAGGWQIGAYHGTCTCGNGTEWNPNTMQCEGGYTWDCNLTHSQLVADCAGTKVEPNGQCSEYGASGYYWNWDGDYCEHGHCTCR